MANVETMEAQFRIRYLSSGTEGFPAGPVEYRGGAGGEMAIVAPMLQTAAFTMYPPVRGRSFRRAKVSAAAIRGGVNDDVWVHAPAEMRNADRFAQKLDTIPGESEPISWGVFPLMGDDALYVRWNGGGESAIRWIGQWQKC